MVDRCAALVIMTLAVVMFASDAVTAEKFQKLSGAQIRARFAGMEMSDGVHWSEVFEVAPISANRDGPTERSP